LMNINKKTECNKKGPNLLELDLLNISLELHSNFSF
jgi:hypothetical protein